MDKSVGWRSGEPLVSPSARTPLARRRNVVLICCSLADLAITTGTAVKLETACRAKAPISRWTSAGMQLVLETADE